MKHQEFDERVWILVNQARNLLEKSGMNAKNIDDKLSQLINEAVNAVCSVQAHCAVITRIGTK